VLSSHPAGLCPLAGAHKRTCLTKRESVANRRGDSSALSRSSGRDHPGPTSLKRLEVSTRFSQACRGSLFRGGARRRLVRVVKSQTVITYVEERVHAIDHDPASAIFAPPEAGLGRIGTDPEL